MSEAGPRLRRPYAFRGRYLTDIDLAVEVDRRVTLEQLRAALSPRLGKAAAQEETEAVLAGALDELGEERLARLSAEVDTLIRTWTGLAQAYRSASDRAEMGRIALELADLPGRLEERVRLVPNAGGLIDAAIPTSVVSRLRYPVAAGRSSSRDLDGLRRRLRIALPVAVSNDLLRVDALELIIERTVRPVLLGLRSAVLPPDSGMRPDRAEVPVGADWEGHDADSLRVLLAGGCLRLRQVWPPRPPPTAQHAPQGVDALAITPDERVGVWGPWEPWCQPLQGQPLQGPAGGRSLGKQDGSGWQRHCLAVAVSADGRRVATGGASVTVWDLATGRALIDLAQAQTAELHTVAFSPCGRRLIAAWASARLEVFDSGTGHSLWQLDLEDPALSAVFSTDGRHVFAGGWSGVLAAYDAETGTRVAVFDDIGGAINRVAVGVAGKLLATAGGSVYSRDSLLNPGELPLRLWDAHSGAVLRDLVGHAQPVTDVGMTADHVISISEDGSLRAWRVRDGQCCAIVDLTRVGDRPTALAVAGQTVLVGTQAGAVAAFDLDGQP